MGLPPVQPEQPTGDQPERFPPTPPAQPAPRRLPPNGQSELIEQVFSGLGSPVTLAYGRHVVGGHLVYQQDIGGGFTVMVYALGEGEWDLLEWLEVNGARVDHTNTAIVHFHPGLDGEIGPETSPGTRNQKFCSLLPAGFSPAMHWPRTAYLVLKLPFDAEAPSDGFSVRASYQCLRVRNFDNTGIIAGYGYSANPARCALDLIVRGYLKPRAAINEALTSAEELRFDWPAWDAWLDACDASVGGEARWESHLPFVQQSDLRAALEWMLRSGRAYLVEKNGKLAPMHDEARASLATYDASDLMPGTLNLARRSVRGRPNRIKADYRDLDSGKGPGTIDTGGTALTGTGTDFLRRFQEAKMIRLTDGAQAGQVRSIASVADDTNAVLDSAFSSDQSGTAYESPNDSYQQQTRQFDDEDHQDEVNRVIAQTLDLGNSTPTRVERALAYVRARAGLSKLPSGRLHHAATDARDVLPGDLVTLPSGQDFAGAQITESLEVTVEPDLSVTLAGIEYDASIFVDTSGDQEVPVPVTTGDSNFTRVTADEKTGADRAFNTLTSDNLVKAVNYHDSAFRNKLTTGRSGSTGTLGSFVTVASWTITKPKGATRYGGAAGGDSDLALTITPDDMTSWTGKGRLKIGAKTSNEISVTNPATTGSGTVTVTGLSAPEASITVELQVELSASGGAPGGEDIQGDFDQVKDEPQNSGNFS